MGLLDTLNQLKEEGFDAKKDKISTSNETDSDFVKKKESIF